MSEHFYRISAGLSGFIVALATSWPLLVAVLIFLYREQFQQLLTAITTKVDKSTSMKMPGFEFSQQTKQTVDSLAQDTLAIKQQITEIKASSTSPEPVPSNPRPAETLESLAEEYNHKTNISDYFERMQKKASIQTRMEALARTNVPPINDFIARGDEGSLLAAVSASVALPLPKKLPVLLSIGDRTKHQFIRNALLLHFVNAVSDLGTPPPDLIAAARDLVRRYEQDPQVRPDDTFRRNLVYYNQILSSLLANRRKGMQRKPLVLAS